MQRNLLNPYTIVNGYLKNTGEIIAYDGIITSDYIPVPKGTTLFVEKFIVNYRPVLMDGKLEASYPSSHTMISIFLSTLSISYIIFGH